MAFTFNELTVLWSFHQQFPSKYTPSVAELEAWDAQLVTTYDAKLADLLTEFEIPISRENKSRVLMIVLVSSGPEGTKTQVRNACRYYQHVIKQDIDSGSAPTD